MASQAIREALKSRSKANEHVHQERVESVRLVKKNLKETAKTREIEEKELADKFLKEATKDRHERALDELTDAIYANMKPASVPSVPASVPSVPSAPSVPSTPPKSASPFPYTAPPKTPSYKNRSVGELQMAILNHGATFDEDATKNELIAALKLLDYPHANPYSAAMLSPSQVPKTMAKKAEPSSLPPVRGKTGKVDKRTKEYKDWAKRHPFHKGKF